LCYIGQVRFKRLYLGDLPSLAKQLLLVAHQAEAGIAILEYTA